MYPSCKSNIHFEIAGSVAAADPGIAKNVLIALLIQITNVYLFSCRLVPGNPDTGSSSPQVAHRGSTVVSSFQHDYFPFASWIIFAYFVACIAAQPALSCVVCLRSAKFFEHPQHFSCVSSFQYICWWLISGNTTAAPLSLYGHPLFLGSSWGVHLATATPSRR